jgi:hypothetical protein
MYNKAIFTGSDYLIVKKTIRESQLTNPDMSILKSLYRCDTVLIKNGILYFCNKINEINYEDI